ncbi:GTPase Era [Fulvivirga sediminis]|uniref:GTPase Era n=1 Tax=Fulvivirga sediminis TaxID=2803949 RepID=A0A937F6G6_9BACT|nr:GTPase Era [Fulvivirga sediminis]MBL3654958.1 GTPase Era [Fulvivirga sediminis]
MVEKSHKAGFVSIIGKPNVGKSTLMNKMVGERLSIITSKAQTTRHRIMGIISGDDFQVIYSDTPGIIKPEYELHNSMMKFVYSSLEDADVVLFVTDIYEKYDEELEAQLKKINQPLIFILNKIDQAKGTQASDKLDYWKENIKADAYLAVSALEGLNVDTIFNTIVELLPEHPAYFPKDELTDKPEKFFVEEIIREKIFLNYKKEVPYSTEVVVTEFKEDDTIIRIRAEIYVERKSQKGIIIGKGGEALKKVGIASRTELEQFFDKQIHLETFVKVAENWRKKEISLKRFGYRS